MASKHFFRIIFSLVAIIAVGSLTTLPAKAESASANAAQGIEISPALVELNAERGKTYTIKLNVTNVTSSDLVYISSIDDFNAKDESGTPQILMDSNLPATASIKSWVSTMSTFSLKAHKSQTVIAEVKIPNDAEPGGHYGVVRFSGHAPEIEDSGVGLSASAGALVLIRVSGAITEQASVASFYTSRNDEQTSFFEESPIVFVARVTNGGNIHVKPVGSIELRDMFGGLVTTMPINDEKSNVLPDSTRRFEATFNKDWMIGRYSATLTLGYGTTGQALTATTNFWVIPYKVIIVALLALVTLVFIVTKAIKAYNGHIIAKSKNENNKNNKKHGKKA